MTISPHLTLREYIYFRYPPTRQYVDFRCPGCGKTGIQLEEVYARNPRVKTMCQLCRYEGEASEFFQGWTL